MLIILLVYNTFIFLLTKFIYQFEDSQVVLKKGSGRGRGKLRGRSLSYNGRAIIPGSTQPVICEGSANKQHFRGPRMPDGTRGFTMGRGKTQSTHTTAP